MFIYYDCFVSPRVLKRPAIILMVMQLNKLKSMLIMITILCYQHVHRLISLLHICKYNFDRSSAWNALEIQFNIEQEVDHRIQFHT